MRILEIILPVLVMLVLGMACRKLKLLTKSGIFRSRISVEAAYERRIPQVSAVYGQCI